MSDEVQGVMRKEDMARKVTEKRATTILTAFETLHSGVTRELGVNQAFPVSKTMIAGTRLNFMKFLKSMAWKTGHWNGLSSTEMNYW